MEKFPAWMRRTTATALVVVMTISLGIVASAQFRRQRSRLHQPPTDTAFVFARVQFSSGLRGFMGGRGWAHDYPDAEEHILQLANEATGINTQKMSYVIVRLDSEEIFNYPFIYFSEVGEMGMTETETQNLREYFNRGGFAMIDDFYGGYELANFVSEMKRVFPTRDLVELSIEHPIFHTFYEIPTLGIIPPYKPYRQPGPPKFYGYFDDHGRMLMIINHNNDLGDFWEWIGQPRYPLEPSTVALRFGINYLIYTLSH